MNKRFLTIALLGLPMLFGTNAVYAQPWNVMGLTDGVTKEVSYLTVVSAWPMPVYKTDFDMPQAAVYDENVVLLQKVTCGEHRINDSF